MQFHIAGIHRENAIQKTPPSFIKICSEAGLKMHEM